LFHFLFSAPADAPSNLSGTAQKADHPLRKADGRFIHETGEDDMRIKALPLIVLFVLFTFACGARAQRSEKSADFSLAWNDNSLTAVQKTGRTCPPNNVLAFDNAIQIIETGGLRIAIWGDNRATPSPALDHYLKNVDVLILPIESILTRAEADAIIAKYGPKAVIPAHYFLSGLTTDVSGLESADAWVDDQEKIPHTGVRRLGSADLTLNAAALKGSHHRVYYFGNHYEKK
jgi:hypothetical protein